MLGEGIILHCGLVESKEAEPMENQLNTPTARIYPIYFWTYIAHVLVLHHLI